MAAKLTYRFQATVVETLTSQVDGVTSPDVTHDKFNEVDSLDGTTTVPVTTVFSDTVALVGGVKTLDLTSLTGVGGSIDATGLKLQLAYFRNPSTNTVALTVDVGAANGYELFGGATGKIIIPIGGRNMFFGADNLDDVAAADAEIDITGTGTESFDVVLVLG